MRHSIENQKLGFPKIFTFFGPGGPWSGLAQPGLDPTGWPHMASEPCLRPLRPIIDLDFRENDPLDFYEGIF